MLLGRPDQTAPKEQSVKDLHCLSWNLCPVSQNHHGNSGIGSNKSDTNTYTISILL